MFLGEYNHTIDEKGRLAIPVKFRSALTAGAVVTRGIDRCLSLYTKDEWEKKAQQFAALPTAQKNSRAFARLMLAGAMDVELDRQGRVVIPDYLRSYAGTKRKVVVAGLYNRMEIWDAAMWAKDKLNAEKGSDAIAEQLGALGV